MSKSGTYACQNVVEMCGKHCDMIVLSTHYLIKNAPNFLRMSQLNVQCVRYSLSREPGTCMLCH